MINYKKNEKIMALFETQGIEIQKKALTLGRIPRKSEIGTKLSTYIKGDDGNIKIETSNIITEDVVIASNPKVLGILNGKYVFNEWLVPKETWKKNYGFEAELEQKEYQKSVTVKAIEIDENVLKILGSKNGLTVKIEVDWSDEGMEVYKGGVLTEQGYGIAPEELKETYQILKN